MLHIPRIVVAGTHSGCGKTTIAGGIMAALTARGYTVQPFKVGPDFIDPSHHTRICGRTSRNLDPFMMGEEMCRETFVRSSSGADVAVIEGVMGLFDGVDGTDKSSTAHVAKILGAPVILVTDVKGMSRSVHALIRGFSGFDPAVTIAGIIYNRVGSARHRQMIAESGTAPALGWITRNEDISLSSRHLGLVMGHESGSLEKAGTVIADSCDLDAILSAARSAPPLAAPAPGHTVTPDQARIAIALDAAFCFYYQDNLDQLRAAGAELVFFSPLTDPVPDADALYFGGGYPELHLPALESSACTAQLAQHVSDGLPVYAECGGLMYLTREIRADRTYRMTGVLPADTEMTKKIQALGYVRGTVHSGTSILPESTHITGHEFHYSRVIPDPDVRYAVTLSRGKGIEGGKDGIIGENAIGTYTHAYFTAGIASALVAAARSHARR